MKNFMDRTDYQTASSLALNRIFGYKPAAALSLIRHFGSAGAVFEQKPDVLDKLIGPFSAFRPLITPAAVEQAEEELVRLREEGCTFVGYGMPGYPPLLAECEDAPAGLYVRSCSRPEEIFGGGPFVSVVGTRDISPYGREWTGRMVAAMGRCSKKPTIVSGLAIGVDITAHLAALEAGLRTIAVIPVGIDSIYPRRHMAAAQRIASTPGCAIVTDFTPCTGAAAFNFLRRNRIIAGISEATILTESKAKGGGTMTARLAAGYGRDVYALPGRIDDVRSAGCNRLIMEKIAEPVTDVTALCSQLSLGKGPAAKGPALLESLEVCYGAGGNESAEKIISIALLISRRRGILPEEIAEELSLDYGSVSAALCLLESDGFICTDLLKRCCIAKTNY